MTPTGPEQATNSNRKSTISHEPGPESGALPRHSHRQYFLKTIVELSEERTRDELQEAIRLIQNILARRSSAAPCANIPDSKTKWATNNTSQFRHRPFGAPKFSGPSGEGHAAPQNPPAGTRHSSDDRCRGGSANRCGKAAAAQSPCFAGG
jgi:hypothetical protein